MRISIASRSTLGHGLGGMENYVAQQIDLFLRLGHSVTLITAPDMEEAHRTELKAKGVDVRFVDGTRSSRYTDGWHRSIGAMIRHSAPDIVVFHGLAGLHYEGAAPAITVPHGSMVLALLNSLQGARPIRSALSRVRTAVRWNEFRAFRKHQLVYFSQYDARLGGIVLRNTRDSAIVIPPTVEDRRGSSARQREVFFAGRLETNKGVLDLIDAWGRADSHGYKLTIAGSGSLASEVSNRSQGESIEYLGRISRDEVSRRLGQARWSFSGGTHWESLGLSAAESMVSGTPMLYRRRGSLPETIGAGGIAFKSLSSLVRCIERVTSMSDDEWLDCHRLAMIEGDRFRGDLHDRAWATLLYQTHSVHSTARHSTKAGS